MLDGYRGRPALDVEAAADALSRLESWLAADLGERVESLEINPLALHPKGRGVVALDARASLAAEAAEAVHRLGPTSEPCGLAPGR